MAIYELRTDADDRNSPALKSPDDHSLGLYAYGDGTYSLSVRFVTILNLCTCILRS
jgi:hypothetical protein